MVPITATLGLVAVVAAYLARNDAAIVFLSPLKTGLLILSGLLFILPSVGVLMLIPNYAYDLRRLYIFVPIGAAIASFGFLMLTVLPIRTIRLRKYMLALLCLLALFPALSRLFVQQSHYVNSANAKAKILLQIVEQAPSFDSRARLMLVTDMILKERTDAGIGELLTNMFDSAIYMLYQDRRPNVAFLCILGSRCSTDDIDVREKYLKNGNRLQRFCHVAFVRRPVCRTAARIASRTKGQPKLHLRSRTLDRYLCAATTTRAHHAGVRPESFCKIMNIQGSTK